jgi:hypothetical protein
MDKEDFSQTCTCGLFECRGCRRLRQCLECNICNFEGKWCHANNTLKAHFESKGHKAAKANSAAEGGKLKMQTGIASIFVAQAQKNKEMGIHTVKYPSSSPIFQVPMVERREYFRKHKCHGYNLKVATYRGVQYLVGSLLHLS